MRILLVHSYYQVRGGEDNVFEHECSLLSKGHIVKSYSFFNRSGWRGAIQFLASVCNLSKYYELFRVIHLYKPDVLHIHNWHYASGPIIIRAAKALNIPIVITLHNYRLLCPSGSLMNNGQLFTDSMYANFPWEAVKNKVFRNSYIMTFWLAFVVWFHKKIGTWKLVDRFLVLTDFAKDLYLTSTLGIDADLFSVKPNFVTQPLCEQITREPYFLYVGRLSEEKGAELLLNAFINSSFQLKIAGDGPSVDRVKSVSRENQNIEYLGILDKTGVQREMQRCTALLFPSIWYEGMPMVILEAYSMGTPVIASNFGVMSSLIQDGINGLHFEVNNHQSLQTVLARWSNMTESERAGFRSRAYTTYMENYTPEANYGMLMDIYRSVISQSTPVEHTSEKVL